MATTFPGTKLTILVELFLGGVWTDISQYVFFDDTVFIHRGFTSEDQGNDSAPDYCFMTFINFDKSNPSSAAGKRFSPRNLSGPYYGNLGINTPVRVSWNAGNGLKVRFEGKIPNFGPIFDNDSIRQVRVQATDTRRQLTTGTGRKINNSPIFTSTTKSTALVSFVPLEDEAGTTIPLIINGGTMAVNGVTNFATNSTLPGAKPLPTLTATSYIIAGPATHNYNGHWQFDFFYNLNPAMPMGATDTIVKRCWVNSTGSSNIAFWDIIVSTTGYQVKAYDRNGTAVVSSGLFTIGSWHAGEWMHHRLMVQNASSTTFDWQFVTFRYDLAFGVFLSGSGVAGQAGNITAAVSLPNAGLAGSSTGEWAFYDAYNLSTVDGAGGGFNTEKPTIRWSRLLDEQSVPNMRRSPAFSDTVFMGPQTSNDLMTNIRECLLANEGFMDSTVGVGGSEGGRLRFTERGYIENQAVALTLDYSARVLKSLKVADDDFGVINDFTARRNNGGSSQVVKTRGTRNVNDRSIDRLGIGRYDSGADYNLSGDDQIPAHAGWQVNKGTVDAVRVVGCDIWFERNQAFAANLLATWETIDTWNRVKITNPPVDIGPDAPDFYIAGYDEVFTQKFIHVSINGRASAPYQVGILDSSGGATSDQRIDSNETNTVSALTASETSVLLYSLSTLREPTQWAHDTGDYRVRIDGEEMTVTAVSTSKALIGTGTGQTSNNANIVGVPIHASTVKGQLMVLAVACRNVSAIVGCSTVGWEELTSGISSLKLFGKIATAADVANLAAAAPTATVSGGAAGDDLIAQVATFSGATVRVFGDNLGGISINGSAADIIYNSRVSSRVNALYILAALKATPWTSVATASGMTEIAEVQSTVGNDAGLVWDYLYSGATVSGVPGGSLVVTGGIAAVSRSVVVALDTNVQTLTVTRGANNGGVGIVHPADQQVLVVNPIILGV